MCTNYRMNTPEAEVAAIFGARADNPRATHDTDLFPKRSALVVRDDAGLVLDVMNWGFPPPPMARAPVVNVRNLASPFWKSALANPSRRCLVPVSEFCEWEGEAGNKTKRWFKLTDRPLFAFAGIWRPTEAGASFAFLTCEPNPLVAKVHPKAMPVILHSEDHQHWLDGSYDEICVLAAPYPSQLMAIDA